jgi:hypothetical protein
MSCYGEARSLVVRNVTLDAVNYLSEEETFHGRVTEDCGVIAWNHVSTPKKIYSKDPIKEAASPFAAAVNGCTCTGCIDLKAGAIYKMESIHSFL